MNGKEDKNSPSEKVSFQLVIEILQRVNTLITYLLIQISYVYESKSFLATIGRVAILPIFDKCQLWQQVLFLLKGC